MKRKVIFYNPKLTRIARNLRNMSTIPEIKFWNRVKNKKIGYRFIRQKIIENYIIDFYCKELNLAIEIDGSSHGGKLEEDRIRQKVFEDLGVSFLRFSNWEIMNSLAVVVEVIEEWVDNGQLGALLAVFTHSFSLLLSC